MEEGNYIMTMIHDITEREYHGCLQLDNPTHIYNGIYRLEVQNEYGFDQKQVEAHFMKQPWDGEEQLTLSYCYKKNLDFHLKRKC